MAFIMQEIQEEKCEYETLGTGNWGVFFWYGDRTSKRCPKSFSDGVNFQQPTPQESL